MKLWNVIRPIGPVILLVAMLATVVHKTKAQQELVVDVPPEIGAGDKIIINLPPAPDVDPGDGYTPLPDYSEGFIRKVATDGELAAAMREAEKGEVRAIYLTRGNEYNVNLKAVSGTASLPFVYGDTGDLSLPRPVINVTQGTGYSAPKGVSHVRLRGIEFRSSPEIEGRRNGISILGESRDITIEDCFLNGTGFGIMLNGFKSYVSNVRLYRNVVVDSFIMGKYSSGLGIYNAFNIEVRENIFDHNGHHPTLPQSNGNKIRGHNIYTQWNSTVDLIENVSTRASNNAIMARGGGRVLRNVALESPSLIVVGAEKSKELVGRTARNISYTAEVAGNLSANTLEPNWGMTLTNLRTARVEDNLVIGAKKYGMKLAADGWSGNLVLRGNQFYSTGPFEFEKGHVFGSVIIDGKMYWDKGEQLSPYVPDIKEGVYATPPNLYNGLREQRRGNWKEVYNAVALIEQAKQLLLTQN